MKVLVFKDIKNKRWTIWSIDRKTHLGYRKKLTLANCKFVVVESQRQKVISSKKRFPHAWVIGKLIKTKKRHNQVCYNPFKDRSFKIRNKSIKSAKEAYFNILGQVFV